MRCKRFNSFNALCLSLYNSCVSRVKLRVMLSANCVSFGMLLLLCNVLCVAGVSLGCVRCGRCVAFYKCRALRTEGAIRNLCFVMYVASVAFRNLHCVRIVELNLFFA